MKKEYKEYVTESIEYFYYLHDVTCNQKYDDYLPYSFHLKAVDAAILNFKDHIPFDKIKLTQIEEWLLDEKFALNFVRIVGAGHDSIEDARLTYNNIKEQFGEKVADAIFGCTESTGKSRKERKDEAYYKRLIENDVSVFVKLCDMIANSHYSIMTFNKKMIKNKIEDYETLYQKLTEYQKLKFAPLHDYLDYLYAIEI